MPSTSLIEWQTVRMPRLNDLDAQAIACGTALPPNAGLTDENLRGYTVLLCAHFQGFCRDFYSECVKSLAAVIPASLRGVVETQCRARCELDGGNPRFELIRNDFLRFEVDLKQELDTVAANGPRITHLGHLNLWRNYAAHAKKQLPPAGGPLSLATLNGWRKSCDALANEMDRIMYNRLMTLVGVAPW